MYLRISTYMVKKVQNIIHYEVVKHVSLLYNDSVHARVTSLYALQNRLNSTSPHWVSYQIFLSSMLGPRCKACAWWCQHRRDSRHNGLVIYQFFVCNVQSQVPGNMMMPGMMPFMLPGMMQAPFFFNAEVRSSGFVLMWCHCHQRPRQQIPRPIHFLLILVVCCMWLPIAGGFKRWTSIIPSVCPSSSSWGKVFSKLTSIHSVSFAKVI